MSHELKQHIYTSSGGRKFETVAISSNISARARAQLEAQASRYSGSDATADPPLIFRAFHLPAEETYAISILAYTGATFDRSEGNYLAHSYVVPDELVKESNYNLAWIAAHLSIAIGYQPQDPYGADLLLPVSVNIDQSKQLNLFAFLIPEVGERNIYDLFDWLVKRLSNPDSKEVSALQMPPPHEDFQRLYTEAHGPDKSISDNRDFLRLLRLAAAFSILPIGFKRDATFSVNELYAASSASAEYVVTMLRTSAEKRTDGQAWPWLSHCIKLAQGEKWEELSALRDWLSNLLPVDCQPSRSGLDAGFELYSAVEEAKAENRNLTLRQVTTMVGKFRGADFEPRSLHRAIREITNEEDRLEAYAAVCRALDSTGKRPHQELVKEILSFYERFEERSAHSLQVVLERLPAATQVRFWVEADQQGVFPARVRRGYEEVDPAKLRFALESFIPSLFEEEPSTRDDIVDHLTRIVEARRKDYPMLSSFTVEFPELKPSLQGLFFLSSMEATCRRNPQLTHIFIRKFARQIWAHFREDQFESVLKLINYFIFELADTYPPFASGSFVKHRNSILVQTIREIESFANTDFTILIGRMPLSESNRRKLSLVLFQTWLETRKDQFARSFVEMLVELAEVLDDPQTILAHQNPRMRLPKYASWVDVADPNHGDFRRPITVLSDQRKSFYRKITGLLEALPVKRSIPIAASYLRVNPYNKTVFLTIRDIISRKSEAVAEWILSDRSGWHLIPLAELIHVGDSCSQELREILIRAIAQTFEHLPKDGSRNWLIEQLSSHLVRFNTDLARNLARYFPKRL